MQANKLSKHKTFNSLKQSSCKTMKSKETNKERQILELESFFAEIQKVIKKNPKAQKVNS